MARYDDRYIIIDAPPPLVVPDTGALVKKVDGILLVVQYGKTDFDTVEELVEEVGQDKIIGAVINRSKCAPPADTPTTAIASTGSTAGRPDKFFS